ncbi:hypothetical protein O3P69_011588 [Scylla paramamosain]|uniref:Uncharacterized protein n=1 Tax=Scylla paramamosain TaxID=85552 RepID=A0AAW0T7J5_SCYPA
MIRKESWASVESDGGHGRCPRKCGVAKVGEKGERAASPPQLRLQWLTSLRRAEALRRIIEEEHRDLPL